MRMWHDYLKNFSRYFDSDLSRLELTIWLNAFGRGLIAIFIPVILYMNGFGVGSIVLFYLLYNLIDVPLNFVARESVLRFGVLRTIACGIVFEIGYFVILYFAGLSWFWLVALAFCAAVFDAFYWVAHWFVLNRCIGKKGVGSRIGFVKILRRIAAMVAPVVGAVFLIFLSEGWLILLAICFFVLALVPLCFIDSATMLPRKRRRLRSFFKRRRDCVVYFEQGLKAVVSSVEVVILPLFVFVIFESVESVGVLPVIASVAGILFIYFVGRLSDRVDDDLLILVGAVLVGLCWVARIVFPSLNVFYLTTLLIGFFGVLLEVPLDVEIIRRSRFKGVLDTSTYRNAVHMFSNVVLFGVLYFVLEVFDVAFYSAVFVMVVLSLVSVLVLGGKRKF